MSDITSHPAYQATRRCLALVPDAVLFAAVTYEMDMGKGVVTDPECPVCLVGTICRCALPDGLPSSYDGGWWYGGTPEDAENLFGGAWDDWDAVFDGVVWPERAPAIEAAVADELLSRV